MYDRERYFEFLQGRLVPADEDCVTEAAPAVAPPLALPATVEIIVNETMAVIEDGTQTVVASIYVTT